MSFGTNDTVQQVRRVLPLVLPTALQQHGPDVDNKLGNPDDSNARSPFILGLTGLQGSGKSTWATIIVDVLSQDYHLRAITVSLDDFYHIQKVLTELREAKPANTLYATRGQPGTHDEDLAQRFFRDASSTSNGELAIPVFNKSQHSGRGDRAPRDAWPTVSGPIDVIVFEGWCVGFQPVSTAQLQRAHESAQALCAQRTGDGADDGPAARRPTTGTLADHALPHLRAVNDALSRYTASFMGPAQVDALVHLDTEDLANVYAWRIGQEEKLRERTGSGMADEDVVAFVRGYMPAYELYLDGLRKGFYADVAGEEAGQRKKQVRVVLSRGREVQSVEMVEPASSMPVPLRGNHV